MKKKISTQQITEKKEVCEVCGNPRHAIYTKLNKKVLCDTHWSEALLLSIGKATLIILVLIGLFLAL